MGHLAQVTFENLTMEGPLRDPASRQLYQPAWTAAMQYSGQPQGWLTFTGPPGSGKSWLLAAIVNGRLDHQQPAWYTTTANLLDRLRAGYDPEQAESRDSAFEQLCSLPFLALDDLNLHNATPWAQEKIDQLLDHRHNHRRPTVIALQGSLNQVSDRLRHRMADPGQGSRVLPLARRGGSAAAKLGYLSPELRSRTLENFDPQGGPTATTAQRENLKRAWNSAKSYADHPHGWLLLSGPRGCGKTHLAVGIANRCSEKGVTNLRAFVPDLLDYLREAYRPGNNNAYSDLYDEIKDLPLLILDDLSLQGATDWACNKLDQLLVYRYDQGLPLVVTTVHPTSELADESPAIGSRLIDGSVVSAHHITAPNYRLQKNAPAKSPTGTYRGSRS